MSKYSRQELKKAATFYAEIRTWLNSRGLVEVFTSPVRSGATNDIGIQSCRVDGSSLNGWLQSSPELAMKVLLSQGSGDIYQICPAFRDEINSEWHRAQFLMLEWYRVGWQMNEMMAESRDFLSSLSPYPIQQINLVDQLKYRYQIDTQSAKVSVIACAQKEGFNGCGDIISAYDFLIDTIVRDESKKDHWVQCSPYPALIPALAFSDEVYAYRFEYYFNCIEVGHGYVESVDSEVLNLRFDQWQELRKSQGLRLIDKDIDFLNALSDCPMASGVSFGLDRLHAALNGCQVMTGLL